MSALDITALIPVTYLALMGFRKGVLVEFFTLIGLVAGILLCSSLTNTLISFIPGFNSVHPVIPVLLYVIVFILLVIAVSYIGRLIERILKLGQLNFINRLAGLAFGAAKGLFLISLLVWLGSLSGLLPAKAIQHSWSGPFLVSAAPWLLDLINLILPILGEVVQEIESYFSGLAKTFP